MPDYKIMPHNLEAEQAVLGCILLDNSVQVDIFPMLNEDDFYSEAHQSIYNAMLKVYQSNTPVDYVTLSQKLEKSGILEKVGGIEYLTFLTNSVPSAVNFAHYCEIVKGDSIRRQLIKKGQEIIQAAYADEDKENVLQFAEASIFDISQKEEKSSLEHVGKPNGAVKMVYNKFNEIATNPNSVKGIPTGFKEFDTITNGLHNSDLILLAARPGVGKTSLAMNIVVNAATSLKKKCAIFSLEMSREQLMQRAMCSLAKVSMAKALQGRMTPEEWDRIWIASKKLEESGLYVDDSAMTDPNTLLNKCRRLKAKEGLDIVMVDYLGLMSSGKRTESRQVEVSEISRKLKIAAKELNVPIIALSQLSRAPEQRPDHRPLLSDLRDSGSIEQDADIVLFIYNPDKYNDVPHDDEPGTVELIIAKHRNGGTGTVKLRWIGEYTTFVNLDEKLKLPKEQRQTEPQQIEEVAIKETANVFDDEE